MFGRPTEPEIPPRIEIQAFSFLPVSLSQTAIIDFPFPFADVDGTGLDCRTESRYHVSQIVYNKLRTLSSSPLSSKAEAQHEALID